MKSIHKNRNFVIQNMRVVLTLLVILHHATISYTSHKIAAMVIDPRSSTLADYIVGYLDKFFMSAFFFIAGMFVVNSIKKKGSLKFTANRAFRLGIPFVFGWLVLNVPAYYIQYISGIKQTLDPNISISLSGFTDFMKATFGMGSFSGHLWFLWVLLVFNVVSAIIIGVILKRNKENGKSHIFDKAIPSILAMIFIVSVAYIPFTAIGNGWFITIYGPFFVQANRLLLYFTFYTFGLIIGAKGIENTFLSPEEKFVKTWWAQLIMVMATYYVVVINTRIMFTDPANTTAPQLVSCLYPVIALFGTLALYSILACFMNKDYRIMKRLSMNSFGIYVFHYVIVTAWQFYFLEAEVGAMGKVGLVFIATLLTSIIVTEITRKIPVINRVLK